MRLLNIGLPRLGPDNLPKALKKAGLRCANWYAADLKLHVGQAMYHDYLLRKDPLAAFGAYDALTQVDLVNDQGSFWPQMDLSLLRMVREYHPDCAFVLFRRRADDVLEDIDRHSDFRERLTRWGAPGLPAGSAKFDQMVLAWIENHYDAMHVAFGADRRFAVLDSDHPRTRARLARLLDIDLPWWGDETAGARAVA